MEHFHYGLYELSIRLLSRVGALFDQVDPHEDPSDGDPEASDNFYLRKPTNGGVVREIVGVNPLAKGGWSAWHMRCTIGPWSTLWAVEGPAEFVLKNLEAYLSGIAHLVT